MIEHQAELVFLGQMANSPYLTAQTQFVATEMATRPILTRLERGQEVESIFS